jgi:hypothetical protein
VLSGQPRWAAEPRALMVGAAAAQWLVFGLASAAEAVLAPARRPA